MPEVSLPQCPRAKKQQTTGTTGWFLFIFLSSNNSSETNRTQTPWLPPPLFFVPVLSPAPNNSSMHRVEISKEWLQWWIAPRCGSNCADAARSCDLARNHCVDGKSYLEKRKKVCKWQRWRQTQRIIIPQYRSLSYKAQPLFPSTPYLCVHSECTTHNPEIKHGRVK